MSTPDFQPKTTDGTDMPPDPRVAVLQSPEADDHQKSEAFAAIFSDEGQIVLRYLLRQGLSLQDAEDGMQTTMMKAWQAIERFRGQSKLSGWLIQIASNHMVDGQRWRQHRPATNFGDLSLPEWATVEETFATPANSSTDPVMAAETNDLLASVYGLARRLPEAQAKTFISRLGGMEYDEITARAGITYQTAKWQNHMARKEIVEKLSQQDAEAA